MKKIFIVPAGDNRHFYDTIERKRSVEEISRFISSADKDRLNQLYHGKGFIVWGARGTLGNQKVFEKMREGDCVLMTLSGKIVLVAEISYKTNNKSLAKYFWSTNGEGQTWENIYFLINERRVDVPFSKLNKLIGFSDAFSPRGLMSVDTTKQEQFNSLYGDIYSVILSLDEGRDIKVVETAQDLRKEIDLPEDPSEKTSEHTEIQWRLVRLGMAAGNDIWLPANDQGKSFYGNSFKQYILNDFQPGIDVPPYIKNIDTVWKYGYQIKSTFEIENSTSIYSGLLRFSDLKTITPNSVYPMFIVAQGEKISRVFDQLKRPTFKFFNMDKDVGFLDYETIRDLDNKFSSKDLAFNEEILQKSARFLSAN